MVTHKEINAQTQQMGIWIQQSSLLLWWAPQSNSVHTLTYSKENTIILLISKTEYMHRAHTQNFTHALLTINSLLILASLLLIQGGSIYTQQEA